jgi:predicted O-methyltransferase YrrM
LTADSYVGATGKKFDGKWLATNSTRNNLLILNRLLMHKKPSRTLEVGFAFGASTLLFANAHRYLGHVGRQHVAIDPFQVGPFDSVGLQNIAAAGLADHLDFRSTLSSIELPRLLDNGDRFGLIYIDGSHEFDEVFLDAYYCSKLLAPGGMMLFDDSPHPPIARVIKMTRKNHNLTEMDLADWRNDSRLRYRVARLLGRTQLTAFQLRSPSG